MAARICAPLLFLVLLLPLSPPAAACLWDSDTLAMEAQAFPDLPQVIAGRFPRYPSLYYGMRLRRAAAQVKEQPGNLPAYDDAATACDRLGRSDEAVGWMARKRARLEGADRSDPRVTEHWYRYHANLGTILAHRWLKNGADRARVAEMERARNHIAEAIQINPDAHFGREKYQLLVMEWIINPRKRLLGEYLMERLATGPILGPDERAAAVKGLSGLVVLGNAWESVDVFAALAHLLIRGNHASLSHLASLRARELVAAGKRSLNPDAPRDAEALIKELRFVGINPLTGENERHNKKLYAALRADADAWQKHRTAHLLERLREGRHPDTDKAFWTGFQDMPPPRLEYPWPREWMIRLFGRHWQISAMAIGLLGVPLIGVGWVLTARAVKRRAN